MTVLVYGLGRSGLAVSRLLINQGHRVVAFDSKPTDSLRHSLSELNIALLQEIDLNAELCIAAPGIPFDHPDLISLRNNGIETIGEVEWVYRSVKAPIIGITGTAGKGTVTRWTEAVLQAAGHNAVAGGNIDPALSEVAQEGKTLVAELSSFQLERCPTLKPKTAAIINLDVDHLDRHVTVTAYHEAKRQILANLSADNLYIYPTDHPVLSAWAQEITAKTATFSVAQDADATINSSHIVLYQQPLIALRDLSFSSKHQVLNALAVSLICAGEGLSHEDIAQGLRRVKAEKGRCEVIRQLGNISFVEDSIATRSLAVQAALEASPGPIVWIAGGVDKGADFARLEGLIRQNVTLMIGIGQAASYYAAQLKDWTQAEVLSCVSGQDALKKACQLGIEHLTRFHEARGSILLAPLGASFDQFEDYQDRAKTFRQVVEELPEWISCS